MVGLHSLTRTIQRRKQRVGRGQSSGRGKTSGRGTKGQNARSGRKKRPEWRDIIKKLPKRRGFGKNRGRTVVSTRQRPVVVSLERLEALYSNGSAVTRESLQQHQLIHASECAKIVGGGVLSKKLQIKGVAVTHSVRAAVEKAGGTVL